MLVGTQPLGSMTDNQRKIVSLSGLQKKFEACFVLGGIIESLFESQVNVDEHSQSTRSQGNFIFEKSLREMFVFESYRLINWVEQCRKNGLIPKESSLRVLCKRQKKIRELRDYLMHDEEYIVAGKGKKPKRYLSEKEWGVLNPSSTVSFANSTVFGVEIEREIHLGNKIEFFDLFRLVKSSFEEAKRDNFFDLSREFEAEKRNIEHNK